MSLRKYILFFVVFYGKLGFAQSGFNIVQSPQFTMHCDSNCAWMKATFPKPKLTNSYSVGAITYNPTTITGNTIPMYDDSFSSALPIGFPFCFYGNLYTQFCLSDNGILTFNTAYSNAISNNNTQQTLPYFNSTFPDNSILFPFMDLDPAQGGIVKFATIGTAPFRKLIIQYQNMKLFGATCTNSTSSFQIVLSETTNQIEIHITGKVTCDTNPSLYSNFATIGIQNQNASQALTAPNRHASIWTTANEAWLFDPNGGLGYTINWYSQNNNNGLIASNVDSVFICPPTYPFKVWATYSTQCPAGFFTDTVKIIKNLPYLDSVVTVKPLCNGDSSGSITVYGNSPNPPVIYSFMGGPFTNQNSWNNLPVGTYLVSIQDNAGCKLNINVQLLPLNNPIIIVDSILKPDCPDSNGKIQVHITNGTPPYIITWSNGDVGPVADSLWAGIWSVSAVDANGCYISYSFLLQWDSLPVVAYQLTKPICADSSGQIILHVTGGTPAYQYTWGTGSIDSFITNVHTGFYNVVVKDANNCSTNLTFLVNDTLNLKTFSDTLHTSCGLNNGRAKVIPYDGLPPYSFSWSNSSSISDTADNLAAGWYVCTTLDANGCKEVDSFFIKASLPIQNIITKANSNCDSNNGKIYTSPSQFTAPLGYLWSNGFITTSLTNLSPGQYWVQITDSVGCTRTDTVQINEDGKPKLIISSYSQPQCNGDSTGSVVLAGQFGTSPYKFSLDGIVFTSTAQIDSVGGGTYLIYIRDANGCTNDTLVNFVQPPALYVSYVADTLICYNDKDAMITLHPGGGTSPIVYSFDGKAFGIDSIFTNYGLGNYLFIIKDNNNCIDSFNIEVAGPPSPLDVVFEKFNVPCQDSNNGYIIAKGAGGWGQYNYLWTTGQTAQVLTDLKSGWYTVSITDQKGCSVTKGDMIIQERCCKVVVPNAFSPNNDNVNDKIIPLIISEVEYVNFNVFDRYGTRVFHTSNLGEGWNGYTKNNKPYEIGTYFYWLEYKCVFDDEKKILKGDITLLK